MLTLKLISNILRRIVLISLYGAAITQLVISLSFPILLVGYVQEVQRAGLAESVNGEIEKFWQIFPSAIVESWELGMLWSGFVVAIGFTILIFIIRRFWPFFENPRKPSE